MKIKERLRFYHCKLVWIGLECMYVQFVYPCLKIDIAERLKSVAFQVREFYKYTSVTCEPFEVGVALSIEIGTHPLNLKICHIADAAAKSAFMCFGASEMKTLNQSTLGKHLSRRADNL